MACSKFQVIQEIMMCANEEILNCKIPFTKDITFNIVSQTKLEYVTMFLKLEYVSMFLKLSTRKLCPTMRTSEVHLKYKLDKNFISYYPNEFKLFKSTKI